MRKTLLLLSIITFLATTAGAQESAKDKGLKAITENAVKAQLDFLSSDWTEGRETGTKGAYLAADYIASMFKVYGLKPGGDMNPKVFTRGMTMEEYQALDPGRSYMQNFELIESWPGEEQELSVVTKNGDAVKSVNFNYRTDFSISVGQFGTEGEVPIVFVGYGFQDKENKYDDFKGLDLQGKVVVKLSGFPGHKNPDSDTYKKFNPLNDDRTSIVQKYGYGRRGGYTWAVEKGVLAVIEYNPNRNVYGEWAENDEFFKEESVSLYRKSWNSLSRPDQEPRSVSGLSFTVSNRVIKEILSGLDIDFDMLEKKIEDTGKPASMALPGKYLKFKTTNNSRVIKARNVVGILEGKKKDECIVLGAHYDHMGVEDGNIFNGADDNASGTVGIMTIAKAFIESGKQPEYTMVFCAWTAEEIGLIGSAYFADYPVIKDIKCYMNYDMISRVDQDDPNENKCDFKYTSAYPIFKELTDTHIEKYGINLDIEYEDQDVPVGGSDFSSFSRKGIPIFLLHGKFHDEYHKYTDHSDKANIPYMTDIIRTGYLNLFELANNYQW